jgi:acetoin utilization protein AcuC
MKNTLIYNEELANFSFGKGHPLTNERFKIFFDFFKEKVFPFIENLEITLAKPVDDETLELVHTKEYINTLKLASKGIILNNIMDFVSADNLNPLTGYIPEGIEEASRIIVGSSLLAGKLVVENKTKKAISIGGGMHHAKKNFGEGFCFYNDVAILVSYLKEKYNLKRILVIDTDAHAGNGTSEIFYNDAEVLFVDIHQDPLTLYPGCGFINEIGEGKAKGFNINLVLKPYTSDKAYEYLFDEVIFPLAEEFKPEFIIRYGGSDPHYQDHLAQLGLSLEGFYLIGEKVNQLSNLFTEGKSVDLILSGYNLEILPYAWSNLISGLLGLKIKFSDFSKEDKPHPDSGLKETKEMLRALKKYLKFYWKCMQE